METNLNSNYWQTRYKNAETGWDLGTVSPPLQAYIDQLSGQNSKILIPGAGNAYEAEYLHQKGFTQVYVADFAAVPLNALKQRVPDFPEKHLLQQNFFEIEDKFDIILEQTFFCALDPKLRPAYARKCAELLKPNGKLVGLLFNTEFEKPGPPFGGSAEEYQGYFQPYFHFRTFETATNSVKPREGRELFIILEKK